MYSGSIHLITGCMFSGKTTELIKRINKFTTSGKRCLVVNSSINKRSSKTKSHSGKTLNSKVCEERVNVLYSLDEKLCNFDVIGIDEGQFFPNLDIFCEYSAAFGKDIIVAALNADYKMESFKAVSKLFPKCDSVTYLNAKCEYCGKPASFSKRISKSKVLIDIGGAEKYAACCRKCFYKDNLHLELEDIITLSKKIKKLEKLDGFKGKKNDDKGPPPLEDITGKSCEMFPPFEIITLSKGKIDEEHQKIKETYTTSSFFF